ncbi:MULTISPECIES: trimeric intracellular cation channel family protein [unclassified Jeotgalibaca]|uniref:trimeric intracellular cation channel family protein n=1 Tax=unclassified Jeotgalibaca TaxID=2621505 RepID=UPI003FD003EE
MIELFNFMGIIAFAASGAITALEEKYDILGFYVLGFITSFGGGAIRNLLIGSPIELIWSQNAHFIAAFVTITVVFFVPQRWIDRWDRWAVLFDAIGLAVFSIQGAFAALNAGMPLSGIIVAATLTGSGGGVVRDILAHKEPMILHTDIYALWAAMGGLIIGLDLIDNLWEAGFLFGAIVCFRLISAHYDWRLPRRV